MSSIDQINVQRFYEKIKREVSSHIESYSTVDQVDTNFLASKIKEKLDDFPIADSKANYKATVWGTWTWKQKIVWFFLNKLGFGRKSIREYYESYDPETEIFALPWKYWMEDSPKKKFIFDVFIKPHVPVEYVTLKLTRMQDNVVPEFTGE